MTIETFSIDSEQSLLGGLLLEPWRIDDLPCSPADFYRNDHRVIFQTMADMANEAQRIDLVTVAERLEGLGKINDVGGIAYVASLMQNTPGAANVRHYAQTVHEKAMVRELITVANGIAERCATTIDSADELVAQAEAEIYAIMDKRESREPVSISTAIDEALEYIDQTLEGVTYQPSGLKDLDALLGGFRGGAVYYIAARPSMGKTALMCSIAHHVATAKPIYIATLEMPRREIAGRMMAIDGNVAIGDVRSWEANDYDRLAKAASTLRGMSITIDHQEALTLAQLRSRTRRMKRKSGLGAIFVDYLQLMKQKADSREREISMLSAGMKSLAKELDVPVIVLSQLNRKCEERADKRPMMSDLRESGGIEQDADVIVMLYRDEVYDKDSRYKGVAELLVRKNRHGRIGDVFVQFNAETMHFRNVVHGWEMPEPPPVIRSPRRRFD
ncbi:replicative DNA helicase [Pseudomethylobacillus aquaticus]|uniref:Replicative DNA helicase n=1 Tax=Pseudomethylobacillus aquaticus TaxID=2676064 RepID=A0A3N0V5Y3_9PROT|nr:replicative DNA helicase [Pseudomethylobacillus aquaticus]ROH87984.1 replicative DNA helicase [Pseudomethylobacillus aquaticus]